MNVQHINRAVVSLAEANPLLGRLFFASLELLLLGLLVWLVITCFRLKAPRVSALLWLIVLVKPILTLAVGAPLPLLQVAPASTPDAPPVAAAVSSRGLTVYLDPVPPTAISSTPVVIPPMAFPPAPPRAVREPSVEPPAVLERGPLTWFLSLPATLLLLWLAGVATLLVSTALDRVRLHRFVERTSTPPAHAEALLAATADEMGVRQARGLRVTSELESPAMVGWFRPLVVVPAWLVEPKSKTALAWALRHELTHLKHRDHGANFLRRVAQILFFFHPVTWWASRRWEAAVELACDRAVVQTDDDVTAYAEQLYAILVQARQQRRRTMATGLFATRTQINTRIAALLGTSLRTPARLGVAAALALTCFAGTVFTVGGAFVEGAAETSRETAVAVAKVARPELPARTLVFPSDSSLGTLWIGDPYPYDYTPDQEPDMTEAGGWVKLGDAQGTLEIPAGKVVWLDVGPKRTAVDLAPLANLPANGVQYLDLYRLELEDEALRHIAGMTELEALSLYRTKITNDGLRHLAGLVNLRWLDLGASDISAEGLWALAPLKKLEHLDLNYIKFHEEPETDGEGTLTPPQVTPNRGAAEALAELTALRWLNIKGAKATGDDLKALAPLTELRTLVLDYSPIRDEDLAHLAPFTQLTHLSLERTEIGSDYKTYLAALPALADTNIDYTATPDAAHQMLVIGGRVVNESGAPVEGVSVEFYGDYPESVGMGGDKAMTDALGHWEMRLAAGWTRLMANLIHEDYISDRILGLRPIPPKEQLFDQTATFVMEKGSTFTGTVRDDQGNPVAGALVMNSNLRGTFARMMEDANSVVTDEGGRFTFANLDKKRHEELTIVSEEHAPVVHRLDYESPDVPIAVTLESGIGVEGNLTDAAGVPLADVTVSVDEWRPNHQHGLPREAITDSEGRFTLSHMPDHGTVRLSVQESGYFGASATTLLPLTEPLGIHLIKRTDFQGRVVDATTGQPVTDYDVEMGRVTDSGDYWWFTRFTRADVNRKTGTFTAEPAAIFDGTKRVNFVARIRARGYQITESKVQEAARLGEEVTIALQPKATVKAVVRDAAGAPVEGAQVAWVRDDQHAFLSNGALSADYGKSPAWFEASDAEGQVEFAADETPGVLVAAHEKGLAWFDLRNDQEPVVLDLMPWVRVEGQVHGVQGALTPVVYKTTPPAVRGRDDFFMLVGNAVNTDETGKFIVDHVPAMPLSIGIQRRWEPSHGKYLDPQPGETLQVAIGDGPYAATGRVNLDAVADRVAGDRTQSMDERHLMVRATPTKGNPAEAVHYIPDVDTYGQFRLDGLVEGEYTLSVTAHATPPQNACGRGTPIGRSETTFRVGDGQPDAIDLGALAVTSVDFPQQNTQAPAIEGTDLASDAPWSLASESGKLIILDFWASWCAPCVASMPSLKNTYAELPADKVSLVGLNLDTTVTAAKTLIDEKELPWKQVHIGGWAEDNPVTAAYGVSFIPSVWILDAHGKVLARDVEPEKLAATVADLLKSGA